MLRAALGQRELDDGRAERLTTAELPVIRRRAAWMVLAAGAIGAAAGAIVYAASRAW